MRDSLREDAVVERHIGGRKRIGQAFDQRREKRCCSGFGDFRFIVCSKRRQPRDTLAAVIARRVEFIHKLRDEFGGRGDVERCIHHQAGR